MGEMRKVSIACTDRVQVGFVVAGEEAARDVISAIDGRVSDGHYVFTVVEDVFGNPVALDARRVVAVCVTALSDSEERDVMDAFRERESGSPE